MDALTFTSNIVESVAWPLAFAYVAVSLREEIRKLLARTKRIKHNDTEFEFSEEIKAASEEASTSLPEVPVQVVQNEKTFELAKLSPRGAILESWLGVEEALNNYASRHGLEVDAKHLFTIQNLEFHQVDYQQIGRGVINMLQRLRKIRNDAVHLRDVDIEPESAMEFSQLANRVIQRIEEA
jgi:hypothetical protein